MTSRGVSLAIGVMMISFAFTTFAALGLSEQAGVGISPGIEDSREQAQSQAEDPQATGGGGDSFVGLATGGIQTLNALRLVIVNTSQALQNLGVPTPIASTIQAVVRLAFVLTLLYTIVRVKL
jgi:hypothetical protein